MGMKLYIKDDLGRKFTNLEWAMSDTKLLAGVLINKNYLKTLKTYFRLDISELDRIQRANEIISAHKENWCSIVSLLHDVKKLKQALPINSKPYSQPVFQQLNYVAIEIIGDKIGFLEFTDEYFVEGGFDGDLSDLERLLYHLLHTGATKVHLYCA